MQLVQILQLLQPCQICKHDARLEKSNDNREFIIACCFKACRQSACTKLQEPDLMDVYICIMPGRDPHDPSSRPPAQTDRVFKRYSKDDRCRGKNMMVCKSCSAVWLTDVSLQIQERPFSIWCMGAGLIVNTVSRNPRLYSCC